MESGAGRRIAMRTLLAVTAGGLAGFLGLDCFFPFPYQRLHGPASAIVRDRHGEVLRAFIASDDAWQFPVALNEVAPALKKAILESEDRWYYWHVGVNPLSVARAAWSNWRSGRVVSGASTIPMQIARMVEPKDRTLLAKAAEMFRALQLDWHFSKDELLEIYLNLLPQGGNRRGVGAGAHFYFGKRPEQLSVAEAALLAVLPRSPASYDPTRHAAAALAVRNELLRELGRREAFDEATVALALREALPTRLRTNPFRAPHFARYMVARAGGSGDIATTLDGSLQRIAEERVSWFAKRLRDRGIENVAAVVIENETRALRAMVGSAGFFETPYGGQVNGAMARRSPGSTLKPLLYAMAIDSGLVIPESRLLDVPTDFGGYVPENYDSTYHGQVTVAEALAASLNLPAVRLLARAGTGRFLSLLKRGGLSTLDKSSAHYGLALALGACEATLLDLTNLYCSLRMDGVHRPVRFVPGPPTKGVRIISREAAYLVGETLTEVSRPDLPRSWELAHDVPRVAWKTGTSFGHRDAWAIGFSGRLTIGVWVGNFDGSAVRGISGSEHAGPLLFELFRALEGDSGEWRKPRGLQLDSVTLCAASRDLPGEHCDATIQAEHLPGRSRLARCDWHRAVFVDRGSGHVLSGNCLDGRPYERRVLTVHPPELQAWRRVGSQTVVPLPRVSADCGVVQVGTVPRIVSPQAGTPYLLRPDVPARHQKLPLTAHADASADRLYWYQNGALLGTVAVGDRLFVRLQPGEHRLVAVDNFGRSASTAYRVVTVGANLATGSGITNSD